MPESKVKEEPEEPELPSDPVEVPPGVVLDKLEALVTSGKTLLRFQRSGDKGWGINGRVGQWSSFKVDAAGVCEFVDDDTVWATEAASEWAESELEWLEKLRKQALSVPATPAQQPNALRPRQCRRAVFAYHKAEYVKQRQAKAKAKAKAKGQAKAKGKAAAKASPRGRAAPAPASPAKRKAEVAAASPALKKSRSAEALDKAKAAASSGSRKGGGGGARVVDSRVPNANGLKVVEDYTVKLNQTHIDANNNKFYIIQVLEGDGKYFAWNRWGRVGEDGQNKLMPCATVDLAIKEFEKKFREKTCNPWANRGSFKAVNGKYTIVETEESGGGGQDQAPMGKLTEAQIGKGQAVLEQIQAELKKRSNDSKKLEVLSSEFYTLIPHNFGRNRPPAISTDDMLQAKIELLKFYLRMGFEEIEEETGITPVSGVMQLPLPKSLEDAAGGVAGKGDIKSSTNKGEDLAKKQAGKPTRKMDASLYGAIMLYTSNAIYRDLNQCLRDENRAKLMKYFKYLRLFFESMGCLPKRKVTLWRGLSVDLHDNAQYKVGNTVTWWGVSSCTADINVAKNFAKGCGGKCTIITVESETASDISQITFYSNEKESLLCPGTQLQVKSNKRNGNVCEITLKEVGRVIA